MQDNQKKSERNTPDAGEAVATVSEHGGNSNHRSEGSRSSNRNTIAQSGAEPRAGRNE